MNKVIISLEELKALALANPKMTVKEYLELKKKK